jgi:hypothetical protein
MARPNKAEQLRKQKDAKQKKLLIVLVPVFLALIVWQGPKMLKVFSGPEAAATPAPVTTTAPTDPTAPPPPTGTTETPAAAELSDTDVPPAAGTDRLVSFSRFESRDPFGQPGGGAAGSQTGTDTGTPAPDSEATTLVATIEVNGSSEEVSAGGDFPAADPTFRLVSVTEDTAVIGLVSGSFEGGEATVELAVGEEIELVADPDGASYTVTLVSVG